jgi:hypothetical protein
MLTKLLLLALAGFLVLRLLRGAGIGLRLPRPGATRSVARPRICPACGTPIPGRGPCPCGRG